MFRFLDGPDHDLLSRGGHALYRKAASSITFHGLSSQVFCAAFDGLVHTQFTPILTPPPHFAVVG